MTNQDNPRNVKPYSLYPLTPEEALRRLMSVPSANESKESEKKKSRKRPRSERRNDGLEIAPFFIANVVRQVYTSVYKLPHHSLSHAKLPGKVLLAVFIRGVESTEMWPGAFE